MNFSVFLIFLGSTLLGFTPAFAEQYSFDDCRQALSDESASSLFSEGSKMAWQDFVESDQALLQMQADHVESFDLTRKDALRAAKVFLITLKKEGLLSTRSPYLRDSDYSLFFDANSISADEKNELFRWIRIAGLSSGCSVVWDPLIRTGYYDGRQHVIYVTSKEIRNMRVDPKTFFSSLRAAFFNNQAARLRFQVGQSESDLLVDSFDHQTLSTRYRFSGNSVVADTNELKTRLKTLQEDAQVLESEVERMRSGETPNEMEVESRLQKISQQINDPDLNRLLKALTSEFLGRMVGSTYQFFSHEYSHRMTKNRFFIFNEKGYFLSVDGSPSQNGLEHRSHSALNVAIRSQEGAGAAVFEVLIQNKRTHQYFQALQGSGYPSSTDRMKFVTTSFLSSSKMLMNVARNLKKALPNLRGRTRRWLRASEEKEFQFNLIEEAEDLFFHLDSATSLNHLLQPVAPFLDTTPESGQ